MHTMPFQKASAVAVAPGFSRPETVFGATGKAPESTGTRFAQSVVTETEDDMTTATGTAAKTIRDLAEPAFAIAQENLKEVRRAAAESRRAVEDCVADTRFRIRRYPFGAVAVATAIGAGLGSLLGFALGRALGRISERQTTAE